VTGPAPSTMAPTHAHPTLRIILVGSSPIEQRLRRDPQRLAQFAVVLHQRAREAQPDRASLPGNAATLDRRPDIELIRAPGLLNAVGELALEPLGAEPGPVVIVNEELAGERDLASWVESLRRVDESVRVAGVGSPDPAGRGRHLEFWISPEAGPDELRELLAGSGGRAHMPTQPAPGPAEPRQTPGPEPAPTAPSAIGWDDSQIASVLATGADARSLCFETLRARFGRIIEFTKPEPDHGAGVPVMHRGSTLGWLSAEDGSTDLSAAARWLAPWLVLIEQHAQLRSAAFTDYLTGAWNRRYFERFLAGALERARARRQEVSLLIFDIDDFKRYNDLYGHPAGDDILRETVHLLNSVIRPTDRVARIGGDEFAVVFDSPEGPREPGVRQVPSIVAITQRFQAQINGHHFPKLGQDAQGALTISGGIATFPWDGHDAPSLIARADELVLESKRAGKNVICIGPAQDEGPDGRTQTIPGPNCR